MKRSYFLLFTVCSLLFSVLLWGCGGGGEGTFCSKGAEDIGVDICVTVTPKDSSNVNAFVTDCDNSGTIDSKELLKDHLATVSITSKKINPQSTFDPYPITIKGFTITYIPDRIDSPGIREFTPLGPVNIQLFSDGTISQDVDLVDIERKDEFAQDINSGRFNSNLPQRYTAVYKFFGEKFGKQFESEGWTTFTIGAFCE